tara:strand:+ start:88963 stop:90399 length:1437 start_codon:yes stop_codon:yes gene_type:complete
MKRLLFIFTLSLCLPIISFATHNLGGYIGYKNISGLTYEITVTTYTENSSVTADRCELIVDFGDGTNETVPRTNGTTCSLTPSCAHCGDVINDYKLNKYVVTHTFPSYRVYSITMIDPNRSAGIINLTNSIQTPFTIKTDIEISQGEPNSSPIIIESPNITVSGMDTVRIDLSAFDLDGDVLTYELVIPLDENSNSVSGYSFPSNVGIDPVNGEFKLANPSISGKYVFAVKISECRNGLSLGFEIMEFTVMVSQPPSEGKFLAIPAWQKDYLGRNVLNVSPNDTIDFDVNYQNTRATIGQDIKSYSEIFANGNNGTFTYLSSDSRNVSYNLHWVPTNLDARCAPYVITFRGKSDYGNGAFSKDLTVMVFVKDQSTVGCGSVCGGILSVNNEVVDKGVSVSIAPNPIQNESVIQINSDKTNQNYSFHVYNLLGEKVRMINVQNQSKFTFSKGSLAAGVYVYELSDGVSILANGKLVLVD